MRPNSQDVGLEAAIIERVRNSSLVECARADNVARLKPRTEAVDILLPALARGAGAKYGYGRGAFRSAEKPEREHRWSGRKCECRNE